MFATSSSCVERKTLMRKPRIVEEEGRYRGGFFFTCLKNIRLKKDTFKGMRSFTDGES